MPVTLTYPGVYIEEIPSGVRTITGGSTSTTAFVGRTRLGPLDTPVEVNSFGDFARSFGGIWDLSPLSFSVQQYFQNGGQKAVIVRVANGAAATRFAIPGAAGDLLLDASSPGLWGDNLQISIDTNTTDPANLFNITVNDPGPPTGTGTGDSEVLRNLSADPRRLASSRRSWSSSPALCGSPRPLALSTSPIPRSPDHHRDFARLDRRRRGQRHHRRGHQ